MTFLKKFGCPNTALILEKKATNDILVSSFVMDVTKNVKKS